MCQRHALAITLLYCRALAGSIAVLLASAAVKRGKVVRSPFTCQRNMLNIALIYCRVLAGTAQVVPWRVAHDGIGSRSMPYSILLPLGSAYLLSLQGYSFWKESLRELNFRERESHLHASRAGNELTKKQRGIQKVS